MEKYKICDHCQEKIIHEYTLQENDEIKIFCCNGCLTVYQILNDNGLGGYYQLKDGVESNGRPDYSLEPYSYLDEKEFKEKFQKINNGSYEFSFFVEGVHCVACLWLLEKLPTICPGVKLSKLNMATSVLKLRINEETDLSSVATKIASIGYKPHPILSNSDKEAYSKKEDRRALIRIGIAFSAAGNIMLYSIAVYTGASGFFKTYFNIFSFICAIPIITYCAIPFYVNAKNALKNKELSIDIPIVLALVIGMGMGIYSLLTGADYFYFDTLATLVFLLLFARYILKKVQQKSLGSEDLTSFFSNRSARKINDGVEEETLTRFLQIGDHVSVKAGEVVPIDGFITKGESHINNSLLTGEVMPVPVGKAEMVYMGAKNLDSEIIIKVESSFEQSRFGKILNEIENGWKSESKISMITDQISKRFVIVVFLLSLSFFVYLSIFHNFEIAFSRTLTLLIITCPCALALTTPLALILGLSNMAKLGVLVKSEQVIEKLASAKNIFLDKTGTLTYGEFIVTSFKLLKPDKNLESLLYSLELRSNHPIAKSIVKYCEETFNCEQLEILNYIEHPGIGVSGSYNDQNYEVKSTGEGTDNEFSKIGLYQNGELILTLGLSDQLRQGVDKTIIGFIKQRVTPYILSGDNTQSVLKTTSTLSIPKENILSNQSPEQKRDRVAKNEKSIMVGDGVNDAVALKAAYVGVAVKGSVEVSLRAADVYLSRTGVSHVLGLIKASKYILKIIYRNLAFSFLYNCFGVYLAFTGQVNPLVAAVLMPLSSITVLLSTLFSIKKIKNILI